MTRKLAILTFALLARSLLAQESPFIVGPPRLSVKTFTNWQLVKLTYTVSYLNDYDFLEEEAKPENMSFGPLELDPVLGRKQIIENRRFVGKQISLDLIYYLRHVGEKKGELIIPEQAFRYIKLMPGKSKKGQEVLEVKSEPIALRYDSVLTKDADDIMDEIDFGSFQQKTRLWKYGAVAGFLVSLAGALVLIFKNPFRRKRHDETAESGQEAVLEEERRLAPQEALKLFNKHLDGIRLSVLDNQDDQSGPRAKLCNELRDLLSAYAPQLLPSDTNEEIKVKIVAMGSGKASETLGYLANWLEHNDDILYGLKAGGNIDPDISNVKNIARNLKWYKIKLFNLVARKNRLKSRIAQSWVAVALTKLIKSMRRGRQ